LHPSATWLPTFAAGDLPSPEEIDRDGVGKTGSVRISAGRLRDVASFIKLGFQRSKTAFNQFMKGDIELLLKLGSKGIALRANAGT
jgi:hypothetical protein